MSEPGGVSGVSADVSVRPARPADAPVLGEVQVRVWRTAYDGVLPAEVLDALDPAALATSWQSAVSAPPDRRHRVLVATEADRVVGLVTTSPSGDGDADAVDGEIGTLLVDPDATRRGHGSRLLNAAVDHLRGDSFGRVSAWVPEADEALVAFLHGAGFALDGAHRELITGPDGASVREVRLVTLLQNP